MCLEKFIFVSVCCTLTVYECFCFVDWVGVALLMMLKKKLPLLDNLWKHTHTHYWCSTSRNLVLNGFKNWFVSTGFEWGSRIPNKVPKLNKSKQMWFINIDAPSEPSISLHKTMFTVTASRLIFNVIFCVLIVSYKLYWGSANSQHHYLESYRHL